MKTQKSSGLKRFAFITLALAGIGMVVDGIKPVDAIDSILGVQNAKTPIPVSVAQSDNQTTSPQGEASSSESQPTESQAEEKKEPPAPPKKPLKKFRPSERIEAEQAVDFPYDI